VPENGKQLRRDARDAARRHAHPPVEEAVGPCGSLRRSLKIALGVDHDHDFVDGTRAEVLNEVGVSLLERREEHALEPRLQTPPVVNEEDARARALGVTLLHARGAAAAGRVLRVERKRKREKKKKKKREISSKGKRHGEIIGVMLGFFAGLLLVSLPLMGAGPNPAAPASPSSLSKNLSSSLSSLAKAAVKDGKTAGVSFVVTKAGRVLASGAAGFADLENRVPATAETVYAIGSITKQFTAAAVLLLADEGKLSLDEPLGKFVPDFPEPGRSATLRMLLNHTSGIRSMTRMGSRYWGQAGREIAPADLVSLFAKEPADFPPGEGYAYSNSGYVLLGLVVEKASGRPWGAFLKERFFGPLALTHTRDGTTQELVPHRARGFSREDGRFESAWHVSLSQGYAAGALLSTAPDLAAWTRRLHTAPPVSAASFRAMTTPPLVNGKTTSYGMGMGIDTFGGHRRFFHGGGLPGFDGWVAVFPDDDLVVAVLCNTDGDAGMEIADEIAALALGVPGTKTKVPGR